MGERRARDVEWTMGYSRGVRRVAARWLKEWGSVGTWMPAKRVLGVQKARKVERLHLSDGLRSVVRMRLAREVSEMWGEGVARGGTVWGSAECWVLSAEEEGPGSWGTGEEVNR
jgi:hypothetical protein